MYYIETHSTDPCRNLAFEDYIFTNKREGNWLMLWQNERSVIIGLNQNAAEEADLSYAEAAGIRLVRRRSGGGAVYHDLGNLNYTFITDRDDSLSLGSFAEPVCAALRALGLAAEFSGRNDIVVGGKKVSGTAQRVCGGRVMFHGTLLFDADIETMSAVLGTESGKYSSKSTKSVKSRVGNIKALLGGGMSFEEFRAYMLDALSPGGRTECVLSAEELDAVAELAESYGSFDWNYGRAPRFALNGKRRFAGGTLSVSLTVEGGEIKDIAFSGDYMSAESPAAVEARLRGVRYSRDEVAAALEGAALSRSFGVIDAQDILSLMFDR